VKISTGQPNLLNPVISGSWGHLLTLAEVMTVNV